MSKGDNKRKIDQTLLKHILNMQTKLQRELTEQDRATLVEEWQKVFGDRQLKSRPLLFDTKTDGFGVKVNQDSITFFVQGQCGGDRLGERPRVTLGKYGQAMTVDQARDAAIEVLAQMKKGINPNETKRDLRKAIETKKEFHELTLRAALEDYLSNPRLKPNTIKNYRGSITRCLHDWLDLPVFLITGDMVEKRHRELSNPKPADENRPKNWDGKATANQAMKTLRAIWKGASIKHEGVELDGKALFGTNPVDRLSRTRSWNKEKRCQGVITRPHLGPWIRAVRSEVDNQNTRNYILLLLFSGLRKSEAAKLTWTDVDMANETFLVEDTKNGDPHCLPMSKFLKALFREQWQLKKPGTDYVFHGKASITGIIIDPRHQMEKVTKATGITWNIHDLRRTFITVAEALDIQGYTLKKLINHRAPEITASYIISGAERLRKPMEQISKFLLDQAGLSETGEAPINNVVSLDSKSSTVDVQVAVSR